jgi:hypothetical protein
MIDRLTLAVLGLVSHVIGNYPWQTRLNGLAGITDDITKSASRRAE